jgi:hypothetical protein
MVPRRLLPKEVVYPGAVGSDRFKRFRETYIGIAAICSTYSIGRKNKDPFEFL